MKNVTLDCNKPRPAGKLASFLTQHPTQPCSAAKVRTGKEWDDIGGSQTMRRDCATDEYTKHITFYCLVTASEVL